MRAGRRPATAVLFTVAAVLIAPMAAVAPSAGAQTKATRRDVPVLRSDPAPKVVPEAPVGDLQSPAQPRPGRRRPPQSQRL